MKRLLCLVLAMVMLTSLLSVDAFEVWAEQREGNGAEDSSPDQTETLWFDDRVDVTGKVVEIIDSGTPASYQVGCGVEKNTVRDATVVTLEENILVATGVGTAIVAIDGEVVELTVAPAPVSLLLLIGQSNAEGMVGNANQSIACENGSVYSTYAEANGLTGDAGLTVNNAGDYVPSALTGEYSAVNVNGTDVKLGSYSVNSLTKAGNR